MGGGVNGVGTVFKITPSGTLTTLHSFDHADGFGSQAGLVQAIDGNFYGTTISPGWGTIFKVTPGGTLTTLHDSTGESDGLVQATDGNFYGTASPGGTYDEGTVFKITPSGTLTTLYSFCQQYRDGLCTDGDYPSAGLVQATDGNFYGTTAAGGTSSNCYGDGCGTVFSLSVGLSPFVETQPTVGQVGTPVTILGTNLTGASHRHFQRHGRDLQRRLRVRDHNDCPRRRDHRRGSSDDTWRYVDQQYDISGRCTSSTRPSDALPPGGHAPNSRSDSRRHVAELHRSAARRLRHSCKRRCLFVERHGGAARPPGIPDHLA